MNGIKEIEYKVQKEYGRVLCKYNESMESMMLCESQLGVIIDNTVLF